MRLQPLSSLFLSVPVVATLALQTAVRARPVDITIRSGPQSEYVTLGRGAEIENLRGGTDVLTAYHLCSKPIAQRGGSVLEQITTCADKGFNSFTIQGGVMDIRNNNLAVCEIQGLNVVTGPAILIPTSHTSQYPFAVFAQPVGNTPPLRLINRGEPIASMVLPSGLALGTDSFAPGISGEVGFNPSNLNARLVAEGPTRLNHYPDEGSSEPANSYLRVGVPMTEKPFTTVGQETGASLNHALSGSLGRQPGTVAGGCVPVWGNERHFGLQR